MTTATHCPYCALQCGMEVTVDGPDVTVGPRAAAGRPAGLCQKGWTAAELLTSTERLTTPLARAARGRELEPVSWEEALDRVAGAIGQIQRQRGPDAVAVFGGGGLTNEKAYLLGKFARVALRTSQIDYNGRFCMSSAAAAGIRAFGIDRGLPFPVTDVEGTDVVLLVGSNVAETMPPFVQHLAAMQSRGGAVVVVDPRRTPTARTATLHLQPTPGTDLALANGLLHVASSEGLVDEQYIATRTSGWEAVRASVAAYWPERVERITGVAASDIRAAARMLASAARAMVLTARGAEQHSKGTDTVSAFVNLALALGLPGREHSGYGCLTGQGNGQGGREHGQKADQLPGYRRIDDPAARAHVASVWGIDPRAIPGPGRSATELVDALGTADGPGALLVFGSNLAVSGANGGHVRRRLEALDFLCVSDLVLSETAALADVVLPAAQWAEEDGTTTNLEGRVLRRRRAMAPPVGVRTDLAVLSDLARRLGAPGRWSDDASAVFGELRQASAGGQADYAGITWRRIDAEDGVHWPCPDEAHPGSPRLFNVSFPTPDGRARFVVVEHRAAAETVDADFAVHLTTGRVLQHYQSGAQTRRIVALAAAVPDAYVEMHPTFAAGAGIADGDVVRVASRRGTAVAFARVTDTIRPDTVFMPFHWGGAASANLATNDALDPVSRMPEFKVCAARVEQGPA